MQLYNQHRGTFLLYSPPSDEWEERVHALHSQDNFGPYKADWVLHLALGLHFPRSRSCCGSPGVSKMITVWVISPLPAIWVGGHSHPTTRQHTESHSKPCMSGHNTDMKSSWEPHTVNNKEHVKDRGLACYQPLQCTAKVIYSVFLQAALKDARYLWIYIQICIRHISKKKIHLFILYCKSYFIFNWEESVWLLLSIRSKEQRMCFGYDSLHFHFLRFSLLWHHVAFWKFKLKSTHYNHINNIT